MKDIAACVLLLAAPFASGAAAQDRMSEVQCSGSFDAIAALVEIPNALPTPTVDEAGWCLITDMVVPTSSNSGIRIGALRWRASDMQRFIEDGLPPRALDIEGTGLGVTVQTGDDVFDYLLGLQMDQSQMAFGASLRWDGVQNTVTLGSSYLEFNDTNRIEATARLEGANLTDLASMQTSLGTAGLRNLMIKSEFDGWFETHAVVMLGNILLKSGEGAPQAQVDALKGQVIDVINTLPDVFMPQNSRAALSAFVESLPSPRGSAQLQLRADPTLGAVRLGRFASLWRDATATALVETGLDGVGVQFTWTATEGAK
ncbi:MAG: hypothetical protein P8Q50_11590 [Octadecabacter sp.]|nr:hypothetical protein [Octadecabacter sp.]